MEENKILRIAVVGILIYLIASAIASIFNSVFLYINSSLELESEMAIGGIHIILGIITAVITIVFYNSFFKNKIPSNATIIISFVILLVVAVVAVSINSLSLVVSQVGSMSLSKVVFATHQSSSLLSIQIIMPLTLFVYVLIRIFRK